MIPGVAPPVDILPRRGGVRLPAPDQAPAARRPRHVCCPCRCRVPDRGRYRSLGMESREHPIHAGRRRGRGRGCSIMPGRYSARERAELCCGSRPRPPSARRASARSPGCTPPFSAAGTAMGLDRRAVEKGLRRWGAGRSQRPEEVDPDALRRPPHEAVVRRLARTVDRRGIRPSPTRLQNMDDATDHVTVIDPRHAPRVRRKKTPQPCKLSLRQPKMIVIHQPLLVRRVESRNAAPGNPVYGSGAWPASFLSHNRRHG